MLPKNNMLLIGKYCRKFRINELELTLKDIEGNEDVKTLSAFEHGRSSNINHLLKYVKHCKSLEQQIEFLQGLITTIEED